MQNSMQQRAQFIRNNEGEIYKSLMMMLAYGVA